MADRKIQSLYLFFSVDRPRPFPSISLGIPRVIGSSFRSLMLAFLVLVGCDEGHISVPYKALKDYLGIWHGDGYDPIFVKGVNIGSGLPGTEPGELALDYDLYQRWFLRIHELGFNAFRIYTLHQPRFYRALFEFNNFRPDRPLYLIHGIWLDEDNPTGGIDVYDFTYSLDRASEEVIDAVHGNAEIDPRLGKGFGKYEVDVSKWVIGWIVGREMYGGEAVVANARHSENTSYKGRFLSLGHATPTEAWAVERMDHALAYEWDNYEVTRPVAFSNWPTTDPLTHVSETHFEFPEDGELQSIWEVGEDDVSVDLRDIDTSRAPGGIFASFHNYPYYPNFIYRDPQYVSAEDAIGPNNYYAYLADLKNHYSEIPLMVSEFGVPSSWGNAHFSPPAGMNHGGHDEVVQGQIDARLLQNIWDTKCAGGMLFAWADEWWKRTWIVEYRTFPRYRLQKWFDVTSPEENYGLIAFDPPPVDFGRWEPTIGSGRIKAIRADYNHAFFYLEIDLSEPLGDGETLVIGYDTYRDDLGETVLPGSIRTDLRSEFAFVITAPDQSQLYVTQAYDLFGFENRLNQPWQVKKSTATDGDPWAIWHWVTSVWATNDDHTLVFPLRTHNLGKLKVRTSDQPASNLDAVVLGRTVEIRLPWTMLQFSDPSTLSVIHDDLETEDTIETVKTEGIAVVVAIDDEVVTTERYPLEPWEEVLGAVEREKRSMPVFSEALNTFPDSPAID